MAQPSFQPVIGSGFDALAAQQQFYVNANQRQDAENIAREQQANRDYNAWLGTMALMNRADTEQQNKWGREDYAFEVARQTREQGDAEQRRQFDIGVQQQKETNKLSLQSRKDEFERKLALDKKKEDEQNDVINNFGENYADTIKEKAARLEDLNKKYSDAMTEVMTYGQRVASEIGDRNVTYDASRGKLVPLNAKLGFTPETSAKVLTANEQIADKSASYAWLRSQTAEAEKEWNSAQALAQKNTFIIKGTGKDVWLYSPYTKKSFGQMVKDAKAKDEKTPEPTAWTPIVTTAGPALRVGSVTFGPSAQNPIAPAGFSAGSVSFGDTGKRSVSKVWTRDGSGKLVQVQ